MLWMQNCWMILFPALSWFFLHHIVIYLKIWHGVLWGQSLDSSSGVCDKQGADSSPGGVHEHMKHALSFRWDLKPLVPCTGIGIACKRTRNTYNVLWKCRVKPQCFLSPYVVHCCNFVLYEASCDFITPPKIIMVF